MMNKYLRKYNVVINFESYHTNTDKYDKGNNTTIIELANVDFNMIINDLNKRLVNMDFLGTNLLLKLEEPLLALEHYDTFDLIKDIKLEGTLEVEINEDKVPLEDLDEFLEGVLEIVKAKDSHVLDISYYIDKRGKYNLVFEDEKKVDSLVFSFVIKKLREI
ncbi:MAG: hypothetical protein RSB77_05250 [Bacilli bacterium]